MVRCFWSRPPATPREIVSRASRPAAAAWEPKVFFPSPPPAAAVAPWWPGAPRWTWCAGTRWVFEAGGGEPWRAAGSRLRPAAAGDGCRAPPGGRLYIVGPFGSRQGGVVAASLARRGLPVGRRRWGDPPLEPVCRCPTSWPETVPAGLQGVVVARRGPSARASAKV